MEVMLRGTHNYSKKYHNGIGVCLPQLHIPWWFGNRKKFYHSFFIMKYRIHISRLPLHFVYNSVFGGENHRSSVIVVTVIDYRCGIFCYGYVFHVTDLHDVLVNL